jgi:delta1-piperideine-2-carboxylate reductase
MGEEVLKLSAPNSHHFAALWPDIEPFADEGFITLACVYSKKRMSL